MLVAEWREGGRNRGSEVGREGVREGGREGGRGKEGREKRSQFSDQAMYVEWAIGYKATVLYNDAVTGDDWTGVCGVDLAPPCHGRRGLAAALTRQLHHPALSPPHRRLLHSVRWLVPKRGPAFLGQGRGEFPRHYITTRSHMHTSYVIKDWETVS